MGADWPGRTVTLPSSSLFFAHTRFQNCVCLRLLVSPSSLGDKQKSVEYPSPLDLDVLLMTLKGTSVPPQHTQYITIMGEGQDNNKNYCFKKGKGNRRRQPLAQIHGLSYWSGTVSKQADISVDSLSWVSSRSAAVASLCSACWSLHPRVHLGHT